MADSSLVHQTNTVGPDWSAYDECEDQYYYAPDYAYTEDIPADWTEYVPFDQVLNDPEAEFATDLNAMTPAEYMAFLNDTEGTELPF